MVSNRLDIATNQNTTLLKMGRKNSNTLVKHIKAEDMKIMNGCEWNVDSICSGYVTPGLETTLRIWFSRGNNVKLSRRARTIVLDILHNCWWWTYIRYIFMWYIHFPFNDDQEENSIFISDYKGFTFFRSSRRNARIQQWHICNVLKNYFSHFPLFGISSYCDTIVLWWNRYDIVPKRTLTTKNINT